MLSKEYYNTIVDYNEETLNMLIRYVQNGIELPNILEAVSMKQMSEYDIWMLIFELRDKKNLMNREAIALSDFSENFNKMYATDNNKCFEVAQRLFGKIRSTISGYKMVVKKFCPSPGRKRSDIHVRPSSFVRTVIFNRQWYGDLFPGTYPDVVKALYQELTDFFALTTVTLALCHRVIMDENRIRNNYFILKRIFDDSCRELRNTSRLLTVKVAESELMERKKNAKSLESFIKENFHKYTRAELAQFVILEAIREGNSHGLTDEETLIWGENYQKALEARDVVTRFDSLNLMLRNTKTAGKRGKYDTVELVYFLKWCDVEESKEIRVYNYLKDNYQGDCDFPSWQAVSGKRKELHAQNITDQEMKDSFAKKLAEQSAHVAQMAVMPAAKVMS